MDSWIKRAITLWKEEQVELNSGASLNEFEKAEAQIGYVFPEDFKKLYSIINGFADFEMRGFMLSLWSLDRIIENYTENGGLVMFSDHSLSVCQYGFDKNRVGIFRAYTHHQQGPIEKVAESFEQTIDLFNSDSELLF